MESLQLEVRSAVAGDLPEIMRIFRNAKAFMRASGNHNQWVNGYPSEDLLRADIEKQQLFVITRRAASSDGSDALSDGGAALCAGRDVVCGVFAFIVGRDPTYEVIEDGSWIDDSAYGTIHRIGGDGTAHGILETAVAYCEKRIGHLRIDTHEDNLPMQRAVTRNGFTRCGIIYLEDGSPRIAYERLTCENVQVN